MRDLASFEGHRERLRERASVQGLMTLKDAQLLELLLCYAMPRVDVADIAQALVHHFGSADRAVRAPREALSAVPGMSRAIEDWVLMTGELLAAYEQADPDAPFRIWRFLDLERYLGLHWRDAPAPSCRMIYTDFEGRVLMHTELCRSLNWADPAHALKIVEEALASQARYAFLVLFTGAQPMEMAQWERDYMVLLSRTLRTIGVELLDCAMTGETGIVSMSVRGELGQIETESEKLALHEHYRMGGEALDLFGKP